MVKSAESVVIARTAAEVFQYVADLRNEPNWHVDIATVPPETDPVPVVGKTYALKFKPFLGKTDGTFTALKVEPGARVEYRADFAGLQPRITYTVEPAGEGARFTRGVEMRPSGLKMLMTPMMAFMVPRRNKVFVQNLKRALESGKSLSGVPPPQP
ncbi:SRPBCC family protein [Pseudarthrobacter sp. N5]|uniref:SRPBCC family protein n=1 Tax=Pseudarthrobacter sp. N5 TaxID=3418416 RepID=UPI003CF2CEB0